MIWDRLGSQSLPQIALRIGVGVLARHQGYPAEGKGNVDMAKLLDEEVVLDRSLNSLRCLGEFAAATRFSPIQYGENCIVRVSMSLYTSYRHSCFRTRHQEMLP